MVSRFHLLDIFRDTNAFLHEAYLDIFRDTNAFLHEAHLIIHNEKGTLSCFPMASMSWKENAMNDSSQHLVQNNDSHFDLNCELSLLSQDRKLNKLLKTVVREVRRYAEDQIKHIRRGAEIGKALSAEKDISKLLEMIVDEARAMSTADAGTLYILSRDKKFLRVKILQNDTMGIRISGARNVKAESPDAPFTLPHVPLRGEDGYDNHTNVSSYVALTGKTVNIPDVYEAEGFDFSGTRAYDEKTGYRSKSMLVIPLKNHETNIIGVLQLLNAQDADTGEVLSFPPEYVDLIASLASQAAVALTNTQLIRGLKDQIKRIKRAAEIGKALSVGENIDNLLEMIVDEARDMCNADAGTLYIIDENKNLRFKILQNDTMGIKLAGTGDDEILLPDAPFTIPYVPLYDRNGNPNHSSVSSHVALTGEAVNIQDVYEADESRGFDFTGPRKYDASTGYRSRSMLVMPLKNHENSIIGVLQLLNAQNEESDVISFSPEYEDLIASLASQAAVALTNAQLIRDLRNALQTIRDLFYSFIESIATAIDEKSAYTGGHINRVVQLTLMIAEKINEISEGPFKETHFNENEMEELRMAAWMHDVGKITTPEHVLDKKTKLETIHDRIDLVDTRFQLIAKSLDNEHLKQKIQVLQGGSHDPSEMERLEKELAEKLETLGREFEFVKSCNNTGDFMSDEQVEHIKNIATKTYISDNGERPYLEEDEVRNLCIRKGTLNPDEREAIENHAKMTYRILCTLPFPSSLENVPDYAAAHHEKLDGTGYPLGLSGDDLPLQARVMAVADIFEALTAKDRPYKKPMKLSQAVRILGFMKADNHLDPDVCELFVNSGLYHEYAKKELDPDQIDE